MSHVCEAYRLAVLLNQHYTSRSVGVGGRGGRMGVSDGAEGGPGGGVRLGGEGLAWGPAEGGGESDPI